MYMLKCGETVKEEDEEGIEFRKTEYLLLDLLGDGDKLRLFECSFLQQSRI